jgi:OmpA-OmpF porin, OOP family
MVRVLVSAAAGLALFWAGSTPAEACGVKLSVKSPKMAKARQATASAASRAPIAAGPTDTGQRSPKVTGGADHRSARGAGGGEVESTPVRQARPSRAAARPSAVPRPKPVPAPAPPPADDVTAGDDTDTDSDDTDDIAKVPETRKAPKKDPAAGGMPGRLFFANGSAAFVPTTKNKLDQTVRWLEQNPDKTITVEGHTNTLGNADANQTLSEMRAEAVKNYLVQQGIDESRITATGFGPSKPEFSPGSNPKNRRVVIVVD